MISTHVCIKLDKLQEIYLKNPKTDFMIDDATHRPLTDLEVFVMVREEKAKGYTYFCGCDNRTPEGRCAGHVVQDDIQNEAV